MKKSIVLQVCKSWSVTILLMLLNFSLLAQQGNTTEIPITTKSDEARQLYKDALTQMHNFRHAEARATIDKALVLDPDFASAHLLRAQVSQPDMEASVKHLDKAVSLKDQVSEGEQLLIGLAKANLDNKSEEVHDHLDKLVALHPQDKNAHLLRGQFQYFDNQMDKAIESLNKALAIDPDFAPAYNMLGYAYTRKEDYPKAEAAYKNYIRLLPDEANPYDSMGDLYMKMGKNEEAIKNYKKATEIDPDFNISMTKVGHSLAMMGKLEESRKAYQQAASKATNHAEKAENLLAMADSYLMEGRYNDALQISKKAAKLLQENNNHRFLAWVYLSDAEIQTQMNDLAKAKNSLQAYKDLTSQHVLPPMQAARLDHSYLSAKAMMAAKAKDFTKANSKAEELKAKIEAHPHPGAMKNYHKLAGMISFESGDMKKALTHLEQADQHSPRVLYLQSLAQAKLGNAKKAEEFKKKLNALNEPGFEYALVKASMAKTPKVAVSE